MRVLKIVVAGALALVVLAPGGSVSASARPGQAAQAPPTSRGANVLGRIASEALARDAGPDLRRADLTPEQVLQFCLDNSDKCALSVRHISDGWERGFNADRLQTTASTFKMLVLLAYADAVAAGAIDPERLVNRDNWARFWGSMDGGALASSWEDLNRPSQIRVDDIARQMIRFSDNAAPDWFISELGSAAMQKVLDDYVNAAGHHDRPRPIYGFFNTWVANADEVGVGPRMLADYSGNGAGGYRAEVDALFAKMHKKKFVKNTLKMRCVALPWKTQPTNCTPLFGTTTPEIVALAKAYFSRATPRTYTNLLAGLLQGNLLSPAADAVMRRHFEHVLESPNFSSVFRRYGRKGGGFSTGILNWTAYMDSIETGAQVAVAIMLRDLDSDEVSALDVVVFAEQVARSAAFADLVRDTVPADPGRPELVARVSAVEVTARSGTVGATLGVEMESAARTATRGSTLSVEVEVINTSPHRARKRIEVAAYLSEDSVFDRSDKRIDKAVAGKLAGYGRKIVTLSGHTNRPVAGKFLIVVIDRANKVKESVEGNNVEYQRIR